MALSILAIVIASGALVVSIVSLRWQMRTRSEQRATAVRVSIVEHSLGDQVQVQVIGPPPNPPSRLVYQVTVLVYNDGERNEWLRSVSLWDPSRGHGLLDDVEEQLVPGGAILRKLSVSGDLLDGARENGLVAVADVASSVEGIESDVESLAVEILDEFDQNERARRAFRGMAS